MELNIIEDVYIINIQKDFQSVYPYLKLAFFKNPHTWGSSSPSKELQAADSPIEDVTMFHQSGNIDISPTRITGDVEQDFFHKFGLCVQVFRQSGCLWLETTGTDDWSLEQQDTTGKAHSL